MGYVLSSDLDLRTGMAYMPVAEPIPYPVAPAPESERPARAPVSRPGDANAALHAAWGEYCKLNGTDPRDRAKLRAGCGKLLKREVTSCRELTDAERRLIAKRLNALVDAAKRGAERRAA